MAMKIQIVKLSSRIATFKRAMFHTFLFTLKMEAASSKTSVFYHITSGCHSRDGHDLNQSKILKSSSEFIGQFLQDNPTHGEKYPWTKFIYPLASGHIQYPKRFIYETRPG
jgi:hypothetical protein